MPFRLSVHLTPALVPRDRLQGGVALVIDVLRASTTICQALAAGCASLRPCAEVEEARALGRSLPGKVLLAGERDGIPIPGFDLGNSPAEYTPERCRDATVVLTTTNGTRALVHATEADEVLIAAFVNLSMVCDLLRNEERPIHILCAGDAGAVAMEDVLLAGALAARLAPDRGTLDDATWLARTCHERYGQHLEETFRNTSGGKRLRAMGYDADLTTAAVVDSIPVMPRVLRDPLRIVAGSRR